MSEKTPHLVLLSGTKGAKREDAELVRAFLRHEAGAAADIWERCYPIVRRVIFRLAGPRYGANRPGGEARRGGPGPVRGQGASDVEDLIQEVFLRLYRQLPGLREPAALRGFALAIAVRVSKGELRTRWLKRWLNLFHDGNIPERATRSADLDAREALGHLYAILDGLSPRHRAVFILRQVEGLELTEVATAVDVSVATLKRWLPRILRRVFSQAKGDPLLAAYLAEGGGPGAGVVPAADGIALRSGAGQASDDWTSDL